MNIEYLRNTEEQSPWLDFEIVYVLSRVKNACTECAVKQQTTSGKAFQAQGTVCAKAQSKERASCLQRTTNSQYDWSKSFCDNVVEDNFGEGGRNKIVNYEVFYPGNTSSFWPCEKSRNFSLYALQAVLSLALGRGCNTHVLIDHRGGQVGMGMSYTGTLYSLLNSATNLKLLLKIKY